MLVCSPVAASQRPLPLALLLACRRCKYQRSSKLSDLRAKARNSAPLRSKQFKIVSATSKLREWLDHVLKIGVTFLLIYMIMRVNQDADRDDHAMMTFLLGV